MIPDGAQLIFSLQSKAPSTLTTIEAIVAYSRRNRQL